MQMSFFIVNIRFLFTMHENYFLMKHIWNIFFLFLYFVYYSHLLLLGLLWLRGFQHEKRILTGFQIFQTYKNEISFWKLAAEMLEFLELQQKDFQKLKLLVQSQHFRCICLQRLAVFLCDQKILQYDYETLLSRIFLYMMLYMYMGCLKRWGVKQFQNFYEMQSREQSFIRMCFLFQIISSEQQSLTENESRQKYMSQKNNVYSRIIYFYKIYIILSQYIFVVQEIKTGIHRVYITYIIKLLC